MTFRFDARAALAFIQNGREVPPTVPTFPTEATRMGKTLGGIGTVGEGRPEISSLPADVLDLWEERAAIMEHDGKMPRADAEAAAWHDILRRDA